MELKFKHFVFLNVLDVITTIYALTYLGLAEANPIANSIFDKTGLLFGLVALKLLGLIALWYAISFYPLKIKKLALNIIFFMFVLVVMNNLYRIYEVI